MTDTTGRSKTRVGRLYKREHNCCHKKARLFRRCLHTLLHQLREACGVTRVVTTVSEAVLQTSARRGRPQVCRDGQVQLACNRVLRDGASQEAERARTAPASAASSPENVPIAPAQSREDGRGACRGRIAFSPHEWPPTVIQSCAAASASSVIISRSRREASGAP